MVRDIKIAIICGFGKYFGTGHFVRMKYLKDFLKERGYYVRLFLINRKNDIKDLLLDGFDLIIKDSRDGNKKIERFLKGKNILVFDDFYRYNDLNFNFLYYINALPSTKKFGNINSLNYLLLNENIVNGCLNINNSDKKEKILFLSFGKLDPHKLTSKFLSLIKTQKIRNLIKSNFDYLAILIPEYLKNSRQMKSYHSYNKRDNFIIFVFDEDDYKKYFYKSTFFISHPGLSLYEALFCGKKCLTITPSKYHYKIAKINYKDLILIDLSFYNIITKMIFIKKFENKFNEKINNSIKVNNFIEKIEKEIPKQNINSNIKKLLVDLINEIQNRTERKEEKLKYCVFCKFKKLKIIEYAKDYNIYYCKSCGSLIKDDLIKNVEDFYNKENYFDENYKVRYGKTYIEDRENIKNINKIRVDFIKKLMLKYILNKNFIIKKIEQKKLGYSEIKDNFYFLDIGCGFGFLLEDFKEYLSPLFEKYEINCNFFGIEPNPYVNNYIKDWINFYNVDFDKFYEMVKEKKDLNFINKTKISFKIITCTFIIEHIKNIENFLEKIISLIEDDSILLFAFPNSFGPTFIYEKEKYLKTRPKEHFYDITLRGFKKFLKKFGLKILKVRVPEHHYYRWKEKNKILSLFIKKNVYNFIATKIGFSDTLEVYCKKSLS